MSIAFLPLKVILLTLDFSITIVTFGWVKPLLKRFQKQPLRSAPVANDPFHRVNAALKGNPCPGVPSGGRTLYEMSNYAFQKFASKNFMATREYLGIMKTVNNNNKPVKHFGATIYKTFGEVGKDVHKFGAALRKAGLVAAPKVATLDVMTTPCSLAIFENPSVERTIATQGAFSQSIAAAILYQTCGMDAVIDVLQDVAVSAIMCNKRNVANIIGRMDEIPNIKTIIYSSDAVAKDEDIDVPTAPHGVKIVSFEDFVASGDTVAFPPTPPAPKTIAMIKYTSGSTGRPKGVVITHEQIAASVEKFIYTLGMTAKDVTIAGVTFVGEFCAIGIGCLVCYADPKTMTREGAYPIGALELYSPTILMAPPKIWDVLKKRVEARIEASSPVMKFLLRTAFQARNFAINNGFDTPLFKALVFNKFSASMGGKARVALVGGVTCNSELQSFIRTCLGIPMIQVYGLTETCTGVSFQDIEDLRTGIAGVPLPSMEVKLRSVPNINDGAGAPYLNTDTRDVEGNKVFGRGEILVRGGNVALGYYRRPETTREVFGEDGFFSTGDIGQFMEDGSIRIVDRAKNIVKLNIGEYVSIENMEAAYGNSSFVDAKAGGICCYGDGDMDGPVALMQLDEVAAMRWAQENGVSGDYETVKKSQGLNDAVLKDMHNEGKQGGLNPLEKLVAVTFLSEPWTIENGCMTASYKLQRRNIVEMFKNEFEAVKAKGIF